MRYIGLILMVVVLVSGSLQAQSGGQFCVRAFEDRNANGQLDGGEPFLTRGVSANLLNIDEVTVASALLDDSPTAAQGVICFQFLEPGQYTLVISTADYTPTTPSSFTATISAGTLPTVVQFGGERIVEAPATAPETPANDVLNEANLPRIVLAALGTLIVIAGMVVLGAIIYALAFRPSRPARPYYAQPDPAQRDPRITTGSVSPVITIGEDDPLPEIPEDMLIRPNTPTPGSTPRVEIDDTRTDEDTNEIKPI